MLLFSSRFTKGFTKGFKWKSHYFKKISKSKTFDRKKIYFLELTIFFVNSFDAEKADLSIGGIFRAIRALQRDRPGKNFQNLCILPSIHVYTIASSYRTLVPTSTWNVPVPTSIKYLGRPNFYKRLGTSPFCKRLGTSQLLLNTWDVPTSTKNLGRLNFC